MFNMVVMIDVVVIVDNDGYVIYCDMMVRMIVSVCIVAVVILICVAVAHVHAVVVTVVHVVVGVL